MIRKIINPFEYVAGAKSLIAGLLAIVLISITGFYSKTFFTNVLSYSTAPSLIIDNEIPIHISIILCFMNWFVVSTLFYFAALIFSKSKIRAVDIYGTLALSFAPYLMVALFGFFHKLEKLTVYLFLLINFKDPVNMNINASDIIIALITILILIIFKIWIIALMFNAFKVSANLKGTKLILIFIAVLVSSLIITSYLSLFILNTIPGVTL